MASETVEAMVQMVSEGYTPRSVVESSLSRHPGSSVKVNKATTGTDSAGSSVSIPEGTVVTIVGVGGGSSGVDHHARLPDGRQVVIPFADLGEDVLLKRDDEDEDLSEGLVGAVSKITLNKPLPQSATDWLQGGYFDYGVMLPDIPSDDSSSAVSFLMKAEDQDMLDSAIEALKKLAGTSFKSAKESTMVDWSAMAV